jgi:predicted ArsR family transcriptional regulator
MDGQQPGPLAQPTRARHFAAIRDLDGEATTEQLAGELGLHVNGVRRHLDLMQGAGLLQRGRRRHGRGRPRDVWSIAPGAAGADRPDEEYADVARWLARAISSAPAALRKVEETGREVGRELAHDGEASLPEEIERAFVALGFQPAVRTAEDGTVTCELTNCPYRASVRENPDAVCRLHRGITEGLLEQLAPGSRLTRFEPHDPDEAGCMVEVVPAGAD